jgi:hypothetical protein
VEGSFGVLTPVNRVRFMGTHFVTLFNDGTLQTSTDGITWAFEDTGSGLPLLDIAFDGTNYIIVGPGGHIYKSTNLSAWTDVSCAAITGPTYGIGYNATWAKWVICGDGGRIYWATGANALAGTWTAVVLDNGISGVGRAVIDSLGIGASFVAASLTLTGLKVWGTDDGYTWVLQYSDETVTPTGTPGYSFGIAWTGSVWIIGAASGNILTSVNSQQGSLLLPATWIPWASPTPSQALANLRGRYFGGLRKSVYGINGKQQNPVQWTGGAFSQTTQSWGIAFDPPTSTMNDYSGTNADAAARKIASEWWAFAGEMPSTVLDGSNDSIAEHFPELALGNIEDVATIITVQYQPFGGKYLGAAYIQNVNVDRATAGKPDAFFFAGWDSTGNTYGLALWTFCRNIFLKTGILRATSLTFDSIHDADTLGILWTTVDPDLGTRMRWLCDRPRYLKLTVNGNDSKAAQAQCGCRYKPNTAMLDGRQMPALNSTGYGVVVQADHNYTQGTHVLDIAFPPA